MARHLGSRTENVSSVVTADRQTVPTPSLEVRVTGTQRVVREEAVDSSEEVVAITAPSEVETVHDERRRAPLKRRADASDEGATCAKRIHRQKCPFDDCPIRARTVKRHALHDHVPAVFHDDATEDMLSSFRFQNRRLVGLETLSEMIIGPGANPVKLLRFANRNLILESDTTISDRTRRAMDRLCETAGWPIPRFYTIEPMNSPACLIYWRVMTFLMSRLTGSEPDEMYRRFGASWTTRSRLTKKTRRSQTARLATASATGNRGQVDEVAETAPSFTIQSSEVRTPERALTAPKDDVAKAAPSMTIRPAEQLLVGHLDTPKTHDDVADTAPSADQMSLRGPVSPREAPIEVDAEAKTAPSSPELQTEAGLMMDYEDESIISPVKSLISLRDSEEDILLEVDEAAERPAAPTQPDVQISPIRLPSEHTEGGQSTAAHVMVLTRQMTYAKAVATGAPLSIGVVRPQPSPPRKEKLVRRSETEVSLFDSHFHLDRLAERLRADTTDISTIANQRTEVLPTTKANLVGGVLVFCDPENWSRIPIVSDPQWAITIGLHPKKAPRAVQQDLEHMKTLLQRPNVTGLGEVGLDYSVDPSLWEDQRRTLGTMLQWAKPEQVLVLHVKGTTRDFHARSAYADCFELVRKYCTRDQPIHLHCFVGDASQVRTWRNAFPNCYFSFAGKIVHFDSAQREAMRRVPLERLLIETDSPYLPMVAGLRTTTPAYIGEVASLVANIRREPLSLIAKETTSNGRCLYNRRE
ncbi:MAG: TatD family hydrolase [Sedimenticola sp.]